MTNCDHCGMEIAVRNPSGFCDHLYYPDNCKVCRTANPTEVMKLQAEIDRLRKEVERLDFCTVCYQTIQEKQALESLLKISKEALELIENSDCIDCSSDHHAREALQQIEGRG